MYNFFTANQIKPCGWLKKQLKIQADGLSGNLHKVWPDVKDSAWIGGEREGWERVPYWLDGFIPLAYLLEDAELIATAQKYINAIVEKQQPDGWICPCAPEKIPTYDTWAVQLITKVLVVYYQCSGDERIPDVIYKTLKNYHTLLKNGTVKLFDWGKYRWFECFIAINFIKERHDEEWLCELAQILKDQGTNYNELVEEWKVPLNKWTLNTHIVNLVMMLKSEAVSCGILGKEYTDNAEKLIEILDKYNGTPVGLFTGDECLSGTSPIQGTELCSVVEQMYSYELLYSYTGDAKWMERLEVLAFNALPATISDDMWAHQYLQMSNQINCIQFPGKSLFRTNDNRAHLFGLEPHFGCCTANFNQGWPKLALSAFMQDGNTVISALPVPSTLDCDSMSVSLETNYPFENKFLYTVNAKTDAKFAVRIPSFAKNITVNGKAAENCGMLVFDVAAGNTLTLDICYEADVCVIDRPHELKTVKCGSLVFSVPIKYQKKMYEYEKQGVERKFPYCDYEYIAQSDWNYAYSSTDFEVIRKEISDIPFSSEKPAVTVKAKVKKIAWGLEDGYETVCSKIPQSRKPISDEQEIELYPYGCAKLRMTEIPLV